MMAPVNRAGAEARQPRPRSHRRANRKPAASRGRSTAAKSNRGDGNRILCRQGVLDIDASSQGHDGAATAAKPVTRGSAAAAEAPQRRQRQQQRERSGPGTRRQEEAGSEPRRTTPSSTGPSAGADDASALARTRAVCIVQVELKAPACRKQLRRVYSFVRLAYLRGRQRRYSAAPLLLSLATAAFSSMCCVRR